MSDSYKHHPVSKQKNNKFMKRLAVKRARADRDEFLEGNKSRAAHRKMMDPWDICDWKFTESYQEFKKGYTEYNPKPKDMSDKDYERKIRFEYDKCYRNK